MVKSVLWGSKSGGLVYASGMARWPGWNGKRKQNMNIRRGSRINTDPFPKREPKVQASWSFLEGGGGGGGGDRGRRPTPPPPPPPPPGMRHSLKSPSRVSVSHSDKILASSIFLGWCLANRRIISWRLISMLYVGYGARFQPGKFIY